MNRERKYASTKSSFGRKRKFRGNRHTSNAKASRPADSVVLATGSQQADEQQTVTVADSHHEGQSENVNNNNSATPTCIISRSEKKISLPSESEDSSPSDGDSESSDLEDECAGDENDDLAGSRIIDVSILKDSIESMLVCRFCNSSVRLSESKRRGLGSTFRFMCVNNCEDQNSFSSCATDTNFQNYTVNRRATFAMRCIGADRAELQTFCGLMDMPYGIGKSTVNFINNRISEAASAAMTDSASAAAKQEYDAAETTDSGVRDIDVSNDGTWMTRGHSSNIGTTCVIGTVTGKALDFVTLGKQCKSCDYWENNKSKRPEEYRKWKENHETNGECTKTHTGSSGAMEGDAAVTMFERSVEKHSLRYTSKS